MAHHGLIASYLDELRANLPRTTDLDDVLAEVEDHLREVVAAHVRCGMDEQTAERHALGQFGSAEIVTRAFAAAQRGGIAMPTPVTRFAGLAAMIGGTSIIVVFGLASISQLDVGGTGRWFAPVATASFLLALVGLVGLHMRHRAIYSSLGRVGRWLIPFGVIGLIVSIATWFVIGGIVAQVMIAVGLVLVGIDVWGAGVMDRRALALVGISIPAVLVVAAFGTGQFDWATIASIVGFAGLGSGFAWLGHGLWREPARASAPPTAAV